MPTGPKGFNKRGRIIESKPTPTQAPIEVEELPINSSEELEDEMIKRRSSGAINSGYWNDSICSVLLRFWTVSSSNLHLIGLYTNEDDSG